MAANRHPLMGFVTSCLFSGVTFAGLSWQPIMEKDIINIGVHTINRTAGCRILCQRIQKDVNPLWC